ncbi:hypothetical protein [uncultured Halomonas sp.]|uniref:hypothetical protein n=1 Tax=uncultured Halomonas sp. TaxID=173971 RepID=UPI00262024C6|nr:hypothetical protein [uncultured Halomonas sp.]
MAYTHGTASGAEDLLDKLITFVTSDAGLVAAGQAWQIINGASAPWTFAPTTGDPGTPFDKDILLKGTGLGGQDEIYVGVSPVYRTDLDSLLLRVRGFAGLVAGNDTIYSHINNGPWKRLPLSAGTMEYWFVASGRRIAGVVKIGTVYEAFYLGMFLPYATPATYPYPMMIGAASGIDIRFSDLGSQYSLFWDPRRSAASTSSNLESALTVRHQNGMWTIYRNDLSGYPNVFPYRSPATPRSLGNGRYPDASPGQDPEGEGGLRLRDNFTSFQKPAFGGAYLITPLTLASNEETMPGVFGVLDGFGHVGGFAQGAENIVDVNGSHWLVHPNAYRSGTLDYCAMRLE